MKQILKNTIIAALLMTGLCACQERLGNEMIEIIPVVSEALATKAPDSPSLLWSVPAVDKNGTQYEMEAWVSDNPVVTEFPETKGINTSSNLTTFKTTVFKGTSIFGSIQDKTVSKSGSVWSWPSGEKYYWPGESENLTFCSSVLPSSGISGFSWNNGSNASFTYSNTTAADDILLAIDSQNATTHSGSANITFNHALVNVAFSLDDGFPDNITGISINGAYTQASCEYTGASSISWSNYSGSSTYSQPVSNSTVGNASFLVIPQTLPPGATIKVTTNSGDISYAIGSNPDGVKFSGTETSVNNWSSLAGKTVSIKIKKAAPPIDVMLVIDGSHSMRTQSTESQRDLYKLKNALVSDTGLVKTILGANSQNRIGVALFMGQDYYGYSNNSDDFTPKNGEYTTKSHLKARITRTFNDIKTGINDISGTSLDSDGSYGGDGLNIAGCEFEKHSDNDHDKVIIMFTDGCFCTSGESFTESEAAKIVDKSPITYEGDLTRYKHGNALQLKNQGILIYIVSFYNSSNATVTNYLQYISSDYPNATSKKVSSNYTINSPGTKSGTEYVYQVSSDRSNLTTVLNSVAAAVSGQ